MIPLLESGVAEEAKFAVHALMLLTATVCGAYNIAAFAQRHERHHAVNACVYGVIVWLEAHHTMHHLAAMSQNAESPHSRDL